MCFLCISFRSLKENQKPWEKKEKGHQQHAFLQFCLTFPKLTCCCFMSPLQTPVGWVQQPMSSSSWCA